MTIKSIQTLFSEAMQEIKTINADEALKMVEENNCNLIDIREGNELESTGKVEHSVHIPRGKLEIFLDPNSALFQQGVLDQNKEMVLFCAGGVRSALAVKALKNMGYEKISHIEGGFGSISQSKFKIV
ncbi:rhodanese-like domain-containing protein [Candidatus Pelagibacter bacterium]|jgi:rhodanese-related sulfurtransferase|nr:rhodanese-like domain-containing protein [Candidatus Pelagibacter bacterium]MDB2617406.1 rhodanese-like domain-containing protein [Candidatus Pelagibacter bacterium]MDC0352335.1 rhodanese-like domain-containing protein [Candidatus Pelagibacter sp.]MDC0510641.1 rhodanese-like domain-containing protein [Candidatus Pelagibacter sp.]MDC1176001.1 rhodanese-like domain-containing protein [Candidatus Pelagibacter sp.]|tara:strand:+ start:41 stop:424 length:384 start_codon:yes stop_codon:yes gene_type:complete